jgi:hypothetical protein
MSEELQGRLNINDGGLGRREKLPRSSLIISTLSLVLFAAALSGFSVQYETNDDAAMNMYAAGTGLGQPPSEFLLFQHFIIGLALKFLYLHLPHIPWYGALLYTHLFLSSVVISFVISRLNSRLSIVGLWTVLFILFYMQVIISPQFTICAGYLAVAAILLLYSTVRKPCASKNATLCLSLIASCLLVLAGLVRFYSLLLVLLSMVPLLLYALMTRFAVTVRRLLPILCCVVFASVVLNRAQLAYYEHSPGWEQFYSYNNVRADFIDRHKIVWDESTQSVFQQIGWSQNDLAMLICWFYLDPKVYSFHNLVFISQHASLLPQSKVAWGNVLADFKQSLSSYGGMMTLLLCLLLLTKGTRITQGIVVLSLLWYGALFVGITVVERHLPSRVWLVMLFGVCVTDLVLWCQVVDEPVGQAANTNPHQAKRILSLVVLAFYVACCCGQLMALGKLSDTHRCQQQKFKQDLARLQPRAGQLFVTWGGDFPYEMFQLPTKTEPQDSKMRFLGLGVGNHEPFVQNCLRSFDIDDLYQSFYTRNNVFLICWEAKKKLLIQYIREHYRTKVEIKTVFQGTAFTVSQVRELATSGK